MDHMNIFSLLLVSFPETVLVTALGFMLVGIKPRWRELIIIGVLQSAIAYIARSLPVPFGIHSILQMFLLTLNILLITRLPYRIVLVVAMLGLIIYCSVETVSIPVMLRITGYSMSDVLAHTAIRTLFFLPQALVMLIFIATCNFLKISLIDNFSACAQAGYLVRNFKKDLMVDLIKGQGFIIYVVILLPLLLTIILNNAYIAASLNYFSSEHFTILIEVFGVLIIILTVLSAVAFKKVGDCVEKEYESKRAAENLKNIEQIIDSSRKQRHDFHHQLQTVYGLLENGSYEKARDYINRLFGIITKTRELIKTDNLTVSAILYVKIGLAEAKNIDLEVDVECSLKELPLSPHETSSLLGNLIDNSLEAVEKNLAEQRQVKVKIVLEYGAYVIIFTNTGEPIGPEIREYILKPGFTTKEGHSGLGLIIVKGIIDKYGGSLEISSENEETTFLVNIPLK